MVGRPMIVKDLPVAVPAHGARPDGRQNPRRGVFPGPGRVRVHGFPVEHTGGMKLTHEGKTVTLTGFIVDTETKQVTAVVGGQRQPIFDLNLATLRRQTGPQGTIVASDIALTLSSQAADALNSGPGVTTFAAGLPFGVATLTVAVKA